MAENIPQTLPWNIDEDRLRKIQERAALRRKIYLEVARQMGELDDEPNEPSSGFWLDTIHKVEGVDDSIFERHPERGGPDVSR
jgi:hypothetical protein